MRRLQSKKGFTFIEMIVGMTIVAIVGTGAWFTVTVLTKSAEGSRNRIIATNLTQWSLEEVRKVAATGFDDLNNCTFESGNACGFEDISTNLPEFTRTLEVTNENGVSSELKRVVVTSQWEELGVTREVRSMILLSRPPDPLPGNIIGRVVRQGEPDTLVSKARVSVVLGNNEDSKGVVSANSEYDPDKQHNFDFANVPNGIYELKPGNWSLKIKHKDYEPFGPVDVFVDSNTETNVGPLELVPLPEPGHIKVHMINQKTGLPINNFNDYGEVSVFEKGKLIEEKEGGNKSTHDFEIDFKKSEPRFFTVSTQDSYQVGYVGNYNCIPARSEGFSSSIAKDGVRCGNPYNGPASSDYKLNPGQTIDANAYLVPTPTTTVSGIVRDHLGKPITNPNMKARVIFLWPDGNRTYPFPGKTTLGGSYPYVPVQSDGSYSIVLPATQEFFQNTTSKYMILQVRVTLSQKQCCGGTGPQDKWTGYIRVGPLYENTPRKQDLTVNTTIQDEKCGNAQGNIKDDKTNSPLSGANIRLAGVSPQSYNGGFYKYNCPAQGFRIEQGSYNITATKSGYYSYSSGGNSIYRSDGQVQITQNQTKTVKTIEMWPAGKGNINVTVKGSGGNKVPGAQVSISGPQSSSKKTNGNGQAFFSNVNESWPAPGVIGNSHYNQNPKKYTIKVSAPPVYNSKTQSGVVLKAGTTTSVTIQLEKKGGI